MHNLSKYSTLALNIIALGAGIFVVLSHSEEWTSVTTMYAAIAIILGFWFGRATCHMHKKGKSILLTLGLFTVFNFLHSILDGILLTDLFSAPQLVSIISHEGARQPMLYIILAGMISPFLKQNHYRFVVLPLLVSGVWFAGILLGSTFSEAIIHMSWIEPIADMAVFVFIGDITHHIYEEYQKILSKKHCCHH